ncbi:hypothetical protein ACWCXH_39485 [Kitasatospora sp. NPDC001660]
MRERIEVVLKDGAIETWTLDASTEPPSTVTITAESGATYTGQGSDLFEALQAARRPLDDQMIKLCCNGCRPNAHPSGATRRQGGGLVYLNRHWRPATVRDLVYIFGPAPASKVATVQEQERFWQEFTEGIRQSSWLSVLNPIRWFYLATQSWHGFGNRNRRSVR